MNLSLYRAVRIPKPDGRLRILHIPADELKKQQRQYLANEIRGRPKMPLGLTAFIRGRGIRNAARVHVGKKYLVAVDIRDFFHSVTREHLMRALAFESLTPNEIASRARGLSDLDWRRVPPPVGLLDLALIPAPGRPGRECLPQGGPLSPYLANLAMKPVYFKARKMLKKRGILADLTIYADGIYVSSDDPRVMTFGLNGLKRILWSEGFREQKSKTRVMSHTGAQRVCGIAVNRTMTLPKEKRHEIRGRIHNLYMDALSGKTPDLGEFRSLEGYLSFALDIDKSWAGKLRPMLSFVRLYLEGKKIISRRERRPDAM